MNSQDFVKLSIGVLGSVLGIMVINMYAESVFHQEFGASAMEIDVSAVASAPVADDAGDVGASLDELLLTASMDKGVSVFKKCTICHTSEKGGAKKTGPNLWNVVGNDVAINSEFGYSDAMLAQEGNWTYELLDRYLTKPKETIPKNKMIFNGLKKGTDRAALILYLRSLSDTPIDLPVAAIEEIVEEAAEAMPEPM